MEARLYPNMVILILSDEVLYTKNILEYIGYQKQANQLTFSGFFSPIQKQLKELKTNNQKLFKK